MAGELGYNFFLYEGKVYFRDKIFARHYETDISEADFF